MKLTDSAVRGVAPGKEVRDAGCPGLAVRRQGEGSATFYFLWQKAGKANRLRIGRYPEISLADARTVARQHRATLDQGGLPGVTTGGATTFAELLDLYEARLGKSKDQVSALLAKHVRPKLGALPLAAINRRVVQALVDSIASPSVAGAVGRYITAALTYGEQRGHLETAIRRLDLPEGNGPRQRVLGDVELAALLRDWLPNGINAPARSAMCAVFALCLFTAARRSEIAELRWTEVDMDAGLIRLSAGRSKGNRPTVVVLSPYAKQILAVWPRFDPVLVFPSERPRAATVPSTRPGRAGRGSISGFSRATADCQARTGTTDWSPHDLRRTCATGLARAGVAPHIIEATLNHAAPVLARTYAVHHPVEEIRAALEAWGAKAETLRESASVAI